MTNGLDLSRVQMLDVPLPVILEMLASREPFVISGIDVPEDAVFISASVDPGNQCLKIVVQSQEFWVVSPRSHMPALSSNPRIIPMDPVNDEGLADCQNDTGERYVRVPGEILGNDAVYTEVDGVIITEVPDEDVVYTEVDGMILDQEETESLDRGFENPPRYPERPWE